jgi:hypothetical protein
MPIEVPLVAGSRKTPADLIGKALAELERPLPHGLMADQDPAGREQLLDHPKAQRKPKIQPHAIADHFSREAVTGVARVTGRFHPSPMPRSGHPPVNLTVPFALREVFEMPSSLTVKFEGGKLKRVRHPHLVVQANGLQNRSACCGTMRLREYSAVDVTFAKELDDLRGQGIGGSDKKNGSDKKKPRAAAE